MPAPPAIPLHSLVVTQCNNEVCNDTRVMRHRQGPQLVAVGILGYMIVEKSTQVIYARLTIGVKHIPLVSIFFEELY